MLEGGNKNGTLRNYPSIVNIVEEDGEDFSYARGDSGMWWEVSKSSSMEGMKTYSC